MHFYGLSLILIFTFNGKTKTILEKFEQQKRFIEILKAQIPANISLANEISSLLNVSLDSAYRRLRAETDISLDEAVHLCHHFDIPLEALNDQIPNVVTFKFNRIMKDIPGFVNYWESLLKDLQSVARFEDKKVFFAAEDIPPFLPLGFPDLAAFKLFYWMKSIIGLNEFKHSSFKKELIDDSLIETGKKLNHYYSQIPTTEIWTEETLLSTLKQVRFYWDAGLFIKQEDALIVIDQLEEMIGRIQRQAETAMKIDEKGNSTNIEYTLYLSDLMIGTNCVFLKASDMSFSYISYNSFNSMKTGNKYFNEQNQHWINNLISKSTLISGVSEKQRNQFFKGMGAGIRKLREYIISN